MRQQFSYEWYADEKDVLIRLKQGDKKAFERIFNEYYHRVYHFALSTLYEKTFAEDITQSVFVALWQHRENIDVDKKIGSYIYTIAKNQVYRQTEKIVIHNRYKEYVQNLSVSYEDLESNLDNKFLSRIIDDLIQELPPARRVIFLLSRKENLSNGEIAEKLSISTKTVETQIRRSMLFLKKRLQYYLSLFFLFFI